MTIPPDFQPSSPRARGELDLDRLRSADRTGLLEGIDRAVVFDIPMRTRFRGITRRDGVLFHGPAGWGEVAPFWNYDAEQSAPWLAAGLEQAQQGMADVPQHRRTVRVNVTVPEVGAEQAKALVAASECDTAKVKVAGAHSSLEADLERLAAVREAMGAQGKIRVDINAAWDLDTARRLLPLMDRYAEGLEYAEQPCASVEDLAAVRASVDVPIAADESIRLSADPLAVARLAAADVAVLKVAPLGGVRRALALAERLALPAVVSSALDTSVGIAAGARLAAALPHLEHACGLGTVALFEADVAVPAQIPHAGVLSPGHLHVSQAMVAGVAAGEELTSRWATRLAHMLGALAARRTREAADPSSAVAGVRL